MVLLLHVILQGFLVCIWHFGKGHFLPIILKTFIDLLIIVKLIIFEEWDRYPPCCLWSYHYISFEPYQLRSWFTNFHQWIKVLLQNLLLLNFKVIESFKSVGMSVALISKVQVHDLPACWESLLLVGLGNSGYVVEGKEEVVDSRWYHSPCWVDTFCLLNHPHWFEIVELEMDIERLVN